MSTPQDNGAQRFTPEQRLIKQVHELSMQYLMTGGNNAYLIGMVEQLKEFFIAPDRFNAMRQAEQMHIARSQTPKEDPNPRLDA